MSTNIFTKSSLMEAPVEEVFKWHARPGAIERLSPPWDPLKVLHRSGGIGKGAEVTLRMKAGPVSYKWFARHTDYKENEFFRDEQVRGPFSKWTHTHVFKAHGKNKCILEDRVEYRLPFHYASKFIAQDFINKKLAKIFDYRHRITARDVLLHHSNRNIKPMTILVSGAGGLIGSAVIPFLTTGGHRVIRLVRRPPNGSGDEVFWDPSSGKLSLDGVGKIDAVLHLAGENLGKGRWTKSLKKEIVDSRVKGTRLLAQALAGLEDQPGVMLCASAIGYYGNRGNSLVSENDGPGDDFISIVCDGWEKAAKPALEKGIRTVFLRIGVVLAPEGGALKRLLKPFSVGAGGRIGDGSQYISWVDMEDVIGVIHHALTKNNISGPVNVVSPNPVTNEEFTRSLGKVLARPTPFPIPASVIKGAFGQMGREILLSSTRVRPGVLETTGYEFRNPGLDTALKQMLGKVLS